MANPVVLLLTVVLLVLLTVGHGVLVTLPRLLWTQLHTLWRTFARAAHTPPDPHGEPAIPVYLRVTALRDLRAAWWDGLDLHGRVMGDAQRFVTGLARGAAGPCRRGRSRAGGALVVLLRPPFLLTAVAVVLTATALSIPPLLFALASWALCRVLWTLWWAVWAGVARTGRALRPPTAPCPYTRCGRTIDRPVRLCPTCRAGHRELAPNRYGALHHRCRCGTRLPAVLGLSRLQACCPHCASPLPAGYQRPRVVVLVGGSGAQRSGVHRQGLAELGAAPGSEPALVRTGGRSLLLFDPPGDVYGSQESAAALDVLHHAHGLVLVVDDPAAHSAAVHAVTRVLHVMCALPAHRRPRRLTLLYTRAGQGDDAAVRAQLEAADGGHLLRALDATGIPVRCIPASDLVGTLWWLAGLGGTPGPGTSLTPPPVHRPRATAYRFPRHRVARHTLLLTQVAGYLVLPLALVLLEAGVLPPASFFGAPGAYDKWRHPLTGSVHQVDLTAAATRDWPKLSASYSAPGHPPSAALPGHPGYWSVKGAPQNGNWLRVDFGIPLPLSQVSVDFEPDSVDGPFTLGQDVEAQIGSRTIWDPGTGEPQYHSAGGQQIADRKTTGYDLPLARTVDAIRIGLGSIFDKDQENKLRLREFDILWTSSDILRLHPADDGRLGIENTTDRELAIAVRPPVLPAGWHATLVGRLPHVLGAHDTYQARWRITAPKGTKDRSPVVYAVHITEDGHTVTSRCLALLTASGRTQSLC